MSRSDRKLEDEVARIVEDGGRSSEETWRAQSAVGRSWNSPDGIRRVVAEQGGRLFIETAGRRSHELLKPGELEAEIRRDETNAVSRRKVTLAAQGVTEAEAARAVERADDDGFTAAMSPVTRQRTLAVLDAKQLFDGKLQRRKDAIRALVAQGRRVVGSGKKRRLEAPDGRFYLETDLTKTAMDYAAFLTRERQR